MASPEEQAGVPFGDRAMAHLAAVTSHISARIRPVRSLIIGNDPRLVGAEYSVVVDDTPIGDGSWVEYEGDPSGTSLPIPRLYRQVARVEVSAPAFEEHYSPMGDAVRPAIAWKLGKATLATPLSDEQTHRVLGRGYYDVLLGGGKLVSGLGGMVMSARSFVAYKGVIYAGRVMDLKDYPKDGVIY